MTYKKHGYDGLLVVIEGTDGAGKSTQVNMLKSFVEGLSFCFSIRCNF